MAYTSKTPNKRNRNFLFSEKANAITNYGNFVLALMVGIFTYVSSCNDDKIKQRMEQLAVAQKQLATNQLAVLARLDTTTNQLRLSSVNWQQFNTLLGKTDTTITLSSEQLLLNTKTNKQIAKGDESKFIAAVFRVGAWLPNKDSAMKLNGHEFDDEAVVFSGKMIPIFESQMNNPYLCNDDAMMQLWVNAYVHLHVMGHQGVFSREFGDEFDVSTRSRIDDLTKEQIRRDFMGVWGSVDTVYKYCGDRIKNNTISYIKD